MNSVIFSFWQISKNICFLIFFLFKKKLINHRWSITLSTVGVLRTESLSSWTLICIYTNSSLVVNLSCMFFQLIETFLICIYVSFTEIWLWWASTGEPRGDIILWAGSSETDLWPGLTRWRPANSWMPIGSPLFCQKQRYKNTCSFLLNWSLLLESST